MDSADRTTIQERPNDAAKRSRSHAVWIVIGSGLVAAVLGVQAVVLVRTQLHIHCGMGSPGSEGADTWTCSDGVGYLGVAVVLGAMWFIAVLVGALIAGRVRRDQAARVCLVVLAGASAAWILGWTWYGSSALVDDYYAPMRGLAYWAQEVGPAAIVSTFGMAFAFVGPLLRGRPAQIINWSAALALLIATVMQPGLSINMIPAAGLLAASALRHG